MIKFFLPMSAPPRVTSQQHDISVVRGRPIVYDPYRLKDARLKFLSMLSNQKQNIPGWELICPIEGPVQLITKWIWPAGDKHGDGEWKTTRPDTDNLIKLFKDCMTKTGWWGDDSQVASEVTEKFWGTYPGIYVEVRKL